MESGLPVDLQYSILDSDALPYDSSALQAAVRRLPSLPDCFVATNDIIAIALLDRIAKPAHANQIIYIASSAIMRAST